MALRVLTRSHNPVTGYVEWNPIYYPGQNPPVVKTRHNVVETLTDDVGPGDNRLFGVTRRTYSGLIANGYNSANQSPTGWDKRYVSYPLTTGLTGLDHIAVSSPSDGFLASELLARTNPSRADVDVPIFIAELRDLPLLLKKHGDNLIVEMARKNIEWQFAIRPLISDVKKLLNFKEHADRRYNELKKLYNGGLRRTVQLFDNSATFNRPTELVVSSENLLVISARQTSFSSLRAWGHVKWKPTTLPPKSDAELYALARRAALGLSLNFAQAWELMPWSWLVDWFSSVGSFLNAHRNTVPAQPTSISIMRNQKTTHSLSKWSHSANFQVQWGSVIYETKTRAPATPSLDAYLPWLTLEQWSILGSLVILKGNSQVAS